MKLDSKVAGGGVVVPMGCVCTGCFGSCEGPCGFCGPPCGFGCTGGGWSG